MKQEVKLVVWSADQLRAGRRPGWHRLRHRLIFPDDRAPSVTDPDTVALRALNAKIHADARVDMALATIGDGVMLARIR